MELNDNYSKELILSDEVKGSLIVELVRASTGEVVETREGENLVVMGGREGMAHLWAGQWFSGSPIGYVNQMKFGDKGHDSSDPTLPRDTDINRTQLFTETEGGGIVISKTIASGDIDFPAPNKVRFTASIGAAEGNGSGRQGYSEAGMYRVDDTLAAHKTFGIITKTSEFILTFRWTFQF